MPVMVKITKRGQMKIQQMAFMLMAITLFFVLVALVVLVISLSGLKQTSKDIEEENALLLVTKLANSPEFACGTAYVAKTNCIDLDKVILLANNLDYQEFWGVAKIEIRRISPDNGDLECNSQNLDSCGIINVLSRDIKTLASSSNYVTLCRKTSSNTQGFYDKCDIGLLTITPEDKTNA
jgi:hypothetical protein